jgi:hypothetical protein
MSLHTAFTHALLILAAFALMSIAPAVVMCRPRNFIDHDNEQ